MSSSSTCSGVAASRSPGSTSSIAPRRYVPPCAPTSPSMPGRGAWRFDRGDAALDVDDRVHRRFVDDDRRRRRAVVTRSRERPRRWSDVPTPSGHTMSRLDVRRTEPGRRGACRSASRRAAPACGRAPIETPLGRLVGHRVTLPTVRRDRLPVDGTVRAWTTSSAVPTDARTRLDVAPRRHALTRSPRTVPACPAWSVHDLAAHLVGIPADARRRSTSPTAIVGGWLQASSTNAATRTSTSQVAGVARASTTRSSPCSQGMRRAAVRRPRRARARPARCARPSPTTTRSRSTRSCALVAVDRPSAARRGPRRDRRGARRALVADSRRRRRLDVARRSVGSRARGRTAVAPPTSCAPSRPRATPSPTSR